MATTTERRAAIEREAQERAVERQRRIASQCSPLHGPTERIRIWEELHGLALPRSATHKLVRIIALQTELTVRQVQEEQQRRATGLPSAVAP